MSGETPKAIRIATRGSKLALWQANYVKAILNVLISVFACIVAAWFGVILGRQI